MSIQAEVQLSGPMTIVCGLLAVATALLLIKAVWLLLFGPTVLPPRVPWDLLTTLAATVGWSTVAPMLTAAAARNAAAESGKIQETPLRFQCAFHILSGMVALLLLFPIACAPVLRCLNPLLLFCVNGLELLRWVHPSLGATHVQVNLVAAALAWASVKPAGLLSLNWHPASWAWAVVAGIATLPLAHWIATLLAGSFRSFFPDYRCLPVGLRRTLWLCNVVLAPLWEEVLFRGFLLPSLASCMPLWAAVLLSSAWFAVAHPGSWSFRTFVFFGSLVLSAAFLRTGNLLPSILLHALYKLYCELRQLLFLHVLSDLERVGQSNQAVAANRQVCCMAFSCEVTLVPFAHNSAIHRFTCETFNNSTCN